MRRCCPITNFSSSRPGHCCVYKVYHECNYLQANEGNIDPVHLSFLHKFLEHKDERYTGVRGSEESHYNLIAKAAAAEVGRGGHRYRRAHLFRAPDGR